jgi:hypothetical protein
MWWMVPKRSKTAPDLIRIAEQRADECDEGGEHEHAGHQRAGDPVRETGAVAFLCLRLLDELDDRGEGVVGACRGRLDLQGSGGVDRPGRHRVAGLDFDRDRLSGDRRGVQAGAPGPDDPVGRDPFTGADEHELPDGEVFRRDLDRGAVAADGRGLRDEFE